MKPLFFPRTLKPLPLLFFLMVAACAGWPVQEMSDARQALEAAETAQANIYAKQDFERAKKMLDQANEELSTGNYQKARQHAAEAKTLATQARENAMQAKQSSQP